MARQPLVAVALLLAPLAFAAGVDACSVPCGRIYPLITIQLEGDAPSWELAQGEPLVLPATLTYQFDMMNEGYTLASPNEPVEIRFEFPRKPDWAEMAVEPSVIPIDMNNPTYARPDLADPASPQAQYVVTVPIEVRVSLVGRPVLKDGYGFAKLLVFAKSSESGLYQSGYGIKEVRVVPEGAVHESDVAGERDVFAVSPLPALALQGGEASFAGTTFRLGVPSQAAFWEPIPFTATVDPAPSGRLVFAIHDEEGALVASTLPLDASAGEAALEATLARPGLHTATLTLLPEPGSMTPPLTLAVPFAAGATGAEGHAYPKSYTVRAREGVPAPVGSTTDALAQFERDIPFFVFESAQSVSVHLALASDAPLPLDRGLANLQFSILDPEGTVLQAGSVDPTKPVWSLRVGSVASDGWYVARLKGVGLPAGARYEATAQVNYATTPQARNLADGAPDATGGLLASAGANLTLPVEAMRVWAPGDATPVLEGADGAAYSLTVHDAEGRLAYATGLREGAASFTPPAPGRYRAYAYLEPIRGATPFSPTVRAFTFDVGTADVTVARTFAIEDAYEAPLAAAPTLLGFHVVPVLDGAAPPATEGGELVGADGAASDGRAPGLHYLRVVGQGAPPAGSEVPVRLQQDYAAPQTLAGPAAPGAPSAGLPVPGLAVAIVLAAVGALAVGVALARR